MGVIVGVGVGDGMAVGSGVGVGVGDGSGVGVGVGDGSGVGVEVAVGSGVGVIVGSGGTSTSARNGLMFSSFSLASSATWSSSGERLPSEAASNAATRSVSNALRLINASTSSRSRSAIDIALNSTRALDNSISSSMRSRAARTFASGVSVGAGVAVSVGTGVGVDVAVGRGVGVGGTGVSVGVGTGVAVFVGDGTGV